MLSRTEFLDRAIEENQLTIRALDAKVAAILAAVLAPLALIGRVFAHLEHVYHVWEYWYVFAVDAAFLVTWLVAVGALVLAVAPLSNPALHIPNTKMYNGSFYAGGLYKLNFLDALFNNPSVIANKAPVDYAATVPATEDEIVAELSFEQMKLAYIRDMKLNRLKWGLRFAGTWLIVGICIFLASHYSRVLA